MSSDPPLPQRVLRVACAAFDGPGPPPPGPEALAPLAGDVGSRRYFRYRSEGGPSFVLAVYPEGSRDACRRFLATTDLLARAGVRVPRVIGADCAGGWTWLEDLGPRTLYQRYREVAEPWEELIPFYGAACGMVDKIQALPVEAVQQVGNPPLGAELLRRELALTEESFLEPRGLGGWSRVLDDLVAEIAAVGRVPCHRDFMVRNLVPLAGEGTPALGVLDHQDLRMGPPWYDLASLWNDTLFPPPEVEAGLLAGRVEEGSHRRLYHRVAAQRTLKAVGTFARSGHHSDLIEATLARSRAHLARLPEAAGLDDLLDSKPPKEATP